MTLPNNPQQSDVGFDESQDTWSLFDRGRWRPIDPGVNSYLNRTYSGVSGTGANQVFSQIGADVAVSRAGVETCRTFCYWPYLRSPDHTPR